jgi:hypothetical protein
MPSSWSFVVIDPLLEIDNIQLGDYNKRFQCFKGMSQDYNIPDVIQMSASLSTVSVSSDNISEESKIVSIPYLVEKSVVIIIALHSHAPLSDFWMRVKNCDKIAVTMECCAQFSELSSVGETPIIEFDDYEVYSPKRRVKIYSSLFSPQNKDALFLSSSVSSTDTEVSDSVSSKRLSYCYGDGNPNDSIDINSKLPRFT